MINHRFSKQCLVVMVMCCVEIVFSQSPSNVDLKSNPFESVLKKQQYASIDASGLDEQFDAVFAELSSETVKLNFIDAMAASEAFSCLSSERGNISPQENGNSVIIFDTPETIERITKEIKKADRPIEAVTLKYVGLVYMDANDVSSAVSKLASPAGSIITVGKTNGVILCDTKAHVEALVKEIIKLDQPMAGVKVLPITFEHIDASSAKEALSSMLSDYGTVSIVERTNSLVICDLPKNLELIKIEASSLDWKTPGLTVETVNLKFLQAENLVVALEKMLSKYGSAVANSTSNTIIICDTKDNTAKIIHEIQKVDRTPPQIMVEVVLLDVTLGDDKEIGVNWNVLSSDYRDRYNGIYALDTDPETFYPWDAEANVGVGLGFDASNLGGAVNVVSGTVSALVSAIQSTRDVEIIASPRIMVASGKTAKILAAEQIPYDELSSTSQGGSMTSTQFKEAGVTLEVTAVLADNGEISLSIIVDQSVRTGESLGGVPVIDSRNADTSLLLQDGEVVIIGGLRRREKTVQVTQVPLLGALPLIGNLFRSKHNIILNSELVVVMSPHIDQRKPVPEKVKQKYKELTEQAPITGTVSEP